jgi:hypothetical protein
MTIPSNVLAAVLVFSGILVAVALIALGVPPLYAGPIAVYGISLGGFALGHWIGEVGWIVGNTGVVFGAVVLGVMAGYVNVDLDTESPRALLGWGTFVAALAVPYGLYGGYRAIAERRADRSASSAR